MAKLENAYMRAVEAQAQAQKQLDKLREQYQAADEPREVLRLKLAIEKAEQTLLACIGEVRAAHAAYWRHRAQELRPKLVELARVARQYDLMLHAAGDIVVEPWLVAVRDELGGRAVHLDVQDVPAFPEVSDEFDLYPNDWAALVRDRIAVRKAIEARQ